MQHRNSVVVLVFTAIGLAAGMIIAQLTLKGADVLLAARVLFGFAGAMAGGYTSSWLLTRKKKKAFQI